MKNLPINSPEYETLYNEFSDFVRFKGYSRGTNTSYGYHVREFLFFIETKSIEHIKKVKAPDVISYYEYLQKRPNQARKGSLSDSMIREHLFSLRLFFDYLVDVGELESSPVHIPKFQLTRSKQRQILSVKEIKLLQGCCKTKLEAALLTIAYGCGMRRNEIELLDTCDVLLSKGTVIVRNGKGGKNRTIPLSDGGIRVLKEYVVNERPHLFPVGKMEATQAFFINKAGTRMKGNSLDSTLRKMIQRTESPVILAKNITLHCLRHSIATHLLNNGAGIEFVQEFLGHEEMDTSHLYAKRRRQHLKIFNQINRPSYAAQRI